MAKTDNSINGETRTKKKRKLGKIIGFSILGAFLVLLIAAGIYIYQAVEQPVTLFNSASVATQSTPKPMNENIDATPTNVPSVQPTPTQPTSTTAPFAGQHIVNVLLLGVDPDYKGYVRDGGDYHTDSIIVLAINFDKNTVDMISLPRDAFTHVPGVKGIYKLNASINCGGGKTEAGFKKVCEAASWMLGGINIDYYYAFEFSTVVQIGDMLGGVDFKVDMSYQGSSLKYYKKGMQHLDGTGIYDYMRARKNAPDGSDVERMRRCKAMLKALFQKIKDNMNITQIPGLIGAVDKGLYTNATLQQSIALANFAYNHINVDSIQAHTMGGDINYELGWKFTFINQEARKELIKQVYGIDVPELQYVSREYAIWLGETGFKTIRYLSTAYGLSQYIQTKGTDTLTPDQQKSYDKLVEAYKKTQSAYDSAALSLSSADNRAMGTARNELRSCTIALARSVHYSGELIWTVRKTSWFKDTGINEVTVDFN